jgi:hypothetical protein
MERIEDILVSIGGFGRCGTSVASDSSTLSEVIEILEWHSQDTVDNLFVSS